MPVPSPRNKILPARGNFADLSANVASLLDGEICYAIDQDQYYQNEGGTLVSVGATKAQGTLADSSVQPGDNVSDLTNDAGYITLAEVPGDLVTSVAGRTGDVVLTSTDVGLENVDNTSDANKPISTATQGALDLKADLVGGVIPTSQIPAVAITEFLGSVDNETEMLALVGQPGDWCLRTDVAVGYVIVGADPSVIAGWEAFTVPGSAVTSINGQVGTVVLGPADVGALPTTATSDDISEGSTNLYSQWDNATGGINYADGNVGIGTTSPATFAGDCELAVFGTGGARIGLNATGRNYYIGGDSGSDRLEIGRRISANAADSPDIVLDGSGNVGIGTTSPATKLEVFEDDILINSSNSSAGRSAEFKFLRGDDGSTNGMAAIGMNGAGTNNYLGEIKFYTGLSDAFNTSLEERARIDSDGRLLVGTTSAINVNTAGAPRYATFNVSNATSSTANRYAAAFHSYGSDPSRATEINIAKTMSTNGTNTAFSQSAQVGKISFRAADGSGHTPVADIRADSEGAVTSSDAPGRLVFSTTADGASSPTARMTIKSDGNVGIGTTTPVGKLSVKVGDDTGNVNNWNSNQFLVTSDDGDRAQALGFGVNTSNDFAFLSSLAPGTAWKTMKYKAVDHIFDGQNDQERMRIDSSGRLLVGTTTSTEVAGEEALFQVSHSSGFSASITRYFSSQQAGPLLLFARSRGALNVQVAVEDDDVLGRIYFTGSNGTDFNNIATEIKSEVDGDPFTTGNADLPGRLVFSTTADGASNPTPRMTIKSDGNVGIGTTDPGAKLEVVGETVTNSIAAHIKAANGGNTVGLIVDGDEEAGDILIKARSNNTATPTDTDTKFIVTGQGNVGIGTTDPDTLLTLRETDPTDGILLKLTNKVNQAGSLSGIRIRHNDSSLLECNLLSERSALNAGADFKIELSDSTGTPVERFRIKEGGNVGIGTTDPQTELHVIGLTRVSNLAGTGNRAVYSTAVGTLSNSSSDATLKTNVATLGSQSEVVKQLRPVTYNWIDTEERGEQQEVGFIAQEVQPLVPQVIGVNHDETLSVDYPKLTAVLTKALQEAMERIETLEQRLTDAGL